MNKKRDKYVQGSCHLRRDDVKEMWLLNECIFMYRSKLPNPVYSDSSLDKLR